MSTCPVCRTPFTKFSKPIELNNFLLKIHSLLPAEMQARREELVKDRDTEATVARTVELAEQEELRQATAARGGRGGAAGGHGANIQLYLNQLIFDGEPPWLGDWNAMNQLVGGVPGAAPPRSRRSKPINDDDVLKLVIVRALSVLQLEIQLINTSSLYTFRHSFSFPESFPPGLRIYILLFLVPGPRARRVRGAAVPVAPLAAGLPPMANAPLQVAAGLPPMVNPAAVIQAHNNIAAMMARGGPRHPRRLRTTRAAAVSMNQLPGPALITLDDSQEVGAAATGALPVPLIPAPAPPVTRSRISE